MVFKVTFGNNWVSCPTKLTSVELKTSVQLSLLQMNI